MLAICGHSGENSLESMRLRLLVLSPGRAEWNSQGCQPLVTSKPKIQALEGLQGCWRVGKCCDMCHPFGVQASRGNPSLGLAPQAIACHASSVPVRARRRPFCRLCCGLDYLPPVWALLSFSKTWSRLKLPTFWLGGNSLKVPMYLAIYSCAGTSRNVLSIRQWL